MNKLKKQLKPWLSWLFAIFLVAGAANSGPQIMGGGCADCVLKTGDTMTGELLIALNTDALSIGTTPGVYTLLDSTTLCLGGGTTAGACTSAGRIRWNPNSFSMENLTGGGNFTILGTTGTMNGTLSSTIASGSNAFQATVDGARFDIGTGASDYFDSNGTAISTPGGFTAATLNSSGTNTFSGATPLNLTAQTAGMWCSAATITTACYIESGASAATVGATSASAAVKVFPDNVLDATDYVFSVGNATNAASLFNVTYAGNAGLTGYLASETPDTMFVTYINNVIQTFTYGGGIAPAHDFQVSAVRFTLRTAGSGGTTNATIRISDGVSNCDCAFACNTAAGNLSVACSTAANCDFEASDSMTVSVSGVGDCTVSPDILGNVEFETFWE